MTDKELKFANQLYWQVKGRLIPESWCNDHLQVEKILDGYFKRLWGNHEASVHLGGFEEAWQIRKEELLEEEMENVAVLGYDQSTLKQRKKKS